MGLVADILAWSWFLLAKDDAPIHHKLRVSASHFDFRTLKENTNFNLISSQENNSFVMVRYGTLIIYLFLQKETRLLILDILERKVRPWIWGVNILLEGINFICCIVRTSLKSS